MCVYLCVLRACVRAHVCVCAVELKVCSALLCVPFHMDADEGGQGSHTRIQPGDTGVGGEENGEKRVGQGSYTHMLTDALVA